MKSSTLKKLIGVGIAIAGIGAGAIAAAKKVGHSVKDEMHLAIAVPVTIVAAIPMAITAIAIKLDSPGPVIFKQKRIGKGGKIFEIWKFRSMCQNAEHIGSGVYSEKGDSRVTRVGKFIRATSIDELPQLFNVLKGDMTLIGDVEILGTEIHVKKAA